MSIPTKRGKHGGNNINISNKLELQVDLKEKLKTPSISICVFYGCDLKNNYKL